ncbi:MAG TPA: hypothetical protein VGG88_03710 [Gaiellaceae bacterium]
MSRRAAALAAAAISPLIVLLLGLGLGWFSGGGPAGPPPARPLAARAALVPAQTLFGDPVVATITVVLDRELVAGGSVRVEPSFAPYAPTGLPSVTRTTAGRLETLQYRYTLECVNDGCLPGRAPLTVRFPAFVVSGSSVKQAVSWPALVVSSRLSAAATAAGSPQFVEPDGLPPVRYSVSPGMLGDVLVVLAGLLALAGMLLLVREVLLRNEARRRRAADRRSPLEIALDYVRQAAGRPLASDRRKALGLLAEILDERGDDALAVSADAAAWAEGAPEPSTVLAIADEVESATQGEPI